MSKNNVSELRLALLGLIASPSMDAMTLATSGSVRGHSYFLLFPCPSPFLPVPFSFLSFHGLLRTSLSFPYLSASLPLTPFASESCPVTPESSRTSDSLRLARTRLYTSGLVQATSILFSHFITLPHYFPRSLARLLYIPLPLHYHMPPRTL